MVCILFVVKLSRSIEDEDTHNYGVKYQISIVFCHVCGFYFHLTFHLSVAHIHFLLMLYLAKCYTGTHILILQQN